MVYSDAFLVHLVFGQDAKETSKLKSVGTVGAILCYIFTLAALGDPYLALSFVALSVTSALDLKLTVLSSTKVQQEIISSDKVLNFNQGDTKLNFSKAKLLFSIIGWLFWLLTFSLYYEKQEEKEVFSFDQGKNTLDVEQFGNQGHTFSYFIMLAVLFFSIYKEKHEKKATMSTVQVTRLNIGRALFLPVIILTFSVNAMWHGLSLSQFCVHMLWSFMFFLFLWSDIVQML
jgi:hypothetical protein